MKYFPSLLMAFLALLAWPLLGHAQTTGSVQEMHQVLEGVYDEMIPLSEKLINLCRAIAAFGTTFYIGYRVWKHIANAEPIDFFPLFRPLVMTILLGMYTQVLGVINGILKPSVTATAAMVTKSNDAIHALLLEHAKTILQNPDDDYLITPPGVGDVQNWQQYEQPVDGGDGGGGIGSVLGGGFKFITHALVTAQRVFLKYLMSIVFEVLYYAASLCIDTLRTFHLLILAILGPFVFAFSCYDGFHHSLNHWLARYVNIYLWLPVSNILGALLGNIQANMLGIDLVREQSGLPTVFSPTDLAYLIFLAIGCVAYFTIPGIANYIVHTHGPNPIMDKVRAGTSTAIRALGSL